MRDLTTYTWVALILVIVGGINWFFIGLFDFNIIGAILGTGLLARLLYIIVGVGAGYLCYLIYLDKTKKTV